MQPPNCTSGFICCGWHFLHSQARACKGLSSMAWEIFGSCGNAELRRSRILQLPSLPWNPSREPSRKCEHAGSRAVFSGASQAGWFSFPKQQWFYQVIPLEIRQERLIHRRSIISLANNEQDAYLCSSSNVYHIFFPCLSWFSSVHLLIVQTH